MSRLSLITALGACAVLHATSSDARSRSAAADALAAVPGAVVMGSADVPFDYQYWYSNGVVEYAFAAPAWMSPVHGEFDRPARILASLFLAQNSSFLGFTQDLSAFKHLSTTVACDGAILVTFEQTFASLPIESTRITVEVRGQVVSRVASRFIPEVSRLPVCQPSVAGNQIMTALYYRPETERTIVIVEVLEDVVGPKVERLKDACTGAQLGFKLFLN